MLEETRLIISMWESTSFWQPNICEYSRRVCTDIASLPLNKDIFAEDFLHKSCVDTTNLFHYFTIS